MLLSNADFPFDINVRGITLAGILHYRKQYSLFAKMTTHSRAHSLASVLSHIVYLSSREGMLVPNLWGDIFYILLLLEGVIITERFANLDLIMNSLKRRVTKLSD